MCTSEKKLPTRRAQTKVANSLDLTAKEEAGNFGSRMAITVWLALPMATVRKRLRTKNKSIFESIIYKTVWREEHLQAHKENGKSREWIVFHRKEKRKQKDEEGQRQIVGAHFTTTQQKGRIHPLRNTVHTSNRFFACISTHWQHCVTRTVYLSLYSSTEYCWHRVDRLGRSDRSSEGQIGTKFVHVWSWQFDRANLR